MEYGVGLYHTVYADDIVLIAESREELQEMLSVLGKYADKWKFRFHAKKSKVMLVGKGSSDIKLMVNSEGLEEVEA